MWWWMISIQNDLEQNASQCNSAPFATEIKKKKGEVSESGRGNIPLHHLRRSRECGQRIDKNSQTPKWKTAHANKSVAPLIGSGTSGGVTDGAPHWEGGWRGSNKAKSGRRESPHTRLSSALIQTRLGLNTPPRQPSTDTPSTDTPLTNTPSTDTPFTDTPSTDTSLLACPHPHV